MKKQQLLAVSIILKKRFPNLSVQESINLTLDIAEAFEINA